MTRMMPSVRFMQHRVRGVVKEVAAIQKRDDLDALGKYPGVEFVDLFVNTFKGELRVVPFLKSNDAFDDVRIINDLSVLSRLMACESSGLPR